MMDHEASILIQFRNRWQFLGYAEGVCYAAGTAGFVYYLGAGLVPALAAGALVLVGLLAVLRPWNRDLRRASALIDVRLESARYSSGLLLPTTEPLPGLARLQRYRVARELRVPVSRLIPPNGLPVAAVVMALMILGGYTLGHSGLLQDIMQSGEPGPREERIQFTPSDSIAQGISPPSLAGQQMTLVFPGYTGLAAVQTRDPNIRAVTGTEIRWEIRFDGAVAGVSLERSGQRYPLRARGGAFEIRQRLEASGFYSFRFRDTLGNTYVSDLYALEAVPDEAPEVAIEGIPQYSYFEAGDRGILRFRGRLSDDYGIGEAYIVATVSKGSGESVKFREERLPFDTGLPSGTREASLSKTLDLDALGMERGDELYFYVEATDRRTPEANRGRSETFFAVLRDTVSDAFAVEGTLGVDLMPDYFRSQRQLIIDTEKLIADAPGIPEPEFKFRSNELGFDQKALRLKYGQFMGEESEMEMAPPGSAGAGEAASETPGEPAAETGQDGGQDPLADYTHDHDGDNEHHLVEEGQEEAAEDPLHEYLHNHEDPEAATLFEESLRTKLRKALDVMWDAELYLRLYEPEKSLPFQYSALKLIQEIKNSARIYVHRIGFDPPPIKEDKRLTGDIDQVGNSTRDTESSYEGTYPAMREALGRLEEILEGIAPFSDADIESFRKAGEELAARAIEEPGRYLETLRRIQAVESPSGRTRPNFRALRTELLRAVPEPEPLPDGRPVPGDALNSLFLKALSDE